MKITKKGMSRETAEAIYYRMDEYYDTAAYRYHVYRDMGGELRATRTPKQLLGTTGAYKPETITIA